MLNNQKSLDRQTDARQSDPYKMVLLSGDDNKELSKSPKKVKFYSAIKTESLIALDK